MAKNALGLIGYPLGHSFSGKYFTEKFTKEAITNWEYNLYPLEDIHALDDLLLATPMLRGLNVTVPYKIAVMDMLDEISPEAMAVGAVNTINIQGHGNNAHLKGYNTDTYGFETLLKPLLSGLKPKALILGTGGGARAVKYVLDKLGIISQYVSRQKENGLSYDTLDKDTINEHTLIINASPLGMWPAIDAAPDIDYSVLGPGHILIDLVYNPAETLFMHKGRENGATTANGLAMLHAQAEKAWEIWQADAAL